MTITKGEVALFLIAIALWLIFLFGMNILDA
jgi:hypothetical protein